VPEATACPPSVVADTIMRTIELGVTITDAAVDEKATAIFCAPVARDPCCPDRGQQGRYRDTVARPLTDLPVAGYPLVLRVAAPVARTPAQRRTPLTRQCTLEVRRAGLCPSVPRMCPRMNPAHITDVSTALTTTLTCKTPRKSGAPTSANGRRGFLPRNCQSSNGPGTRAAETKDEKRPMSKFSAAQQYRGDVAYLRALMMKVIRPEDLNPLELAAITWALESALDRVVVVHQAAEPAAVTRSIAVKMVGQRDRPAQSASGAGSITVGTPVDLDGGLRS
jgi:hypothetical protein